MKQSRKTLGTCWEKNTINPAVIIIYVMRLDALANLCLHSDMFSRKQSTIAPSTKCWKIINNKEINKLVCGFASY